MAMFPGTITTAKAWWGDLWQRVIVVVFVFLIVVVPTAFFLTIRKQPQPELLWMAFIVSIFGAPLLLYRVKRASSKSLPIEYTQEAAAFIREWEIFERFLDELGGSSASFENKIKICVSFEVFHRNEIGSIKEIRSLRDFLAQNPTTLLELRDIERSRLYVMDIMKRARHHPKRVVHEAARHAIYPDGYPH
jgi:hypothetical protein